MAKTVEPLIKGLTSEFVLDKEKYPDVEETPYGFIYNVNGKSITDLAGQNRKFGMPSSSGGFSLAVDGDESYYDDWESAYWAARTGIGYPSKALIDHLKSGGTIDSFNELNKPNKRVKLSPEEQRIYGHTYEDEL